ncbi:MAG: hypothetical protein ACLT0Y_05275 [Christensenellales bacterium]
MVVINTPLSDEFGESFALFATEQTSASVIMLVKTSRRTKWRIRWKTKAFGCGKPMSKALFFRR